MPVSPEYRRASIEFEKFLLDARETAVLTTTNQTYTMVQGVLQAFRRRLTIPEAIHFAGALPPVLRAIFVADWEVDEPDFRSLAGCTPTEYLAQRGFHPCHVVLPG